MTVAYGHGVMASMLGVSLDQALASWWSKRGSTPVVGGEASDIERGWYMREFCTWRTVATPLVAGWLPL